MAREYPTYRFWLELIQTKVDGKLVLTQGEVQALTGRSYRWVKDKLGVSKDGITSVQLAMTLAEFDSRASVRK